MKKDTHKPLQWSLRTAAIEFGIARDTLAKRIKQASIAPAFGNDGYSTAQICDAKYGDIYGERLRKVSLEADLLELEHKTATGALLPMSVVETFLTDVNLTCREIILTSGMPEETKTKVLTEFERLKDHDFSHKESEEADAESV